MFTMRHTKDLEEAHASMAGFLYGVHQFLNGSKTSEIYYDKVRNLVLNSKRPAKTIDILNKIDSYYNSLPIDRKSVLTGKFSNPKLLKQKISRANKKNKEKPPEKPTKTPSRPPNRRPPNEVPRCCKNLEVKLTKVTVKDVTKPGLTALTGQMNDDVVVVAFSRGKVMDPNPTSYTWPVVQGKVKPSSMGNNSKREPNETVAVVEPANNCQIQLETRVEAWESDFNKIDEYTRNVLDEIKSALLTVAGIPVSPSSGNLLNEILNRLLDLLGLSDDLMGGAKTFSVSGALTENIHIKDLSWKTSGWTFVPKNKNEATLTGVFEEDYGKWEIELTAYKNCN